MLFFNIRNEKKKIIETDNIDESKKKLDDCLGKLWKGDCAFETDRRYLKNSSISYPKETIKFF